MSPEICWTYSELTRNPQIPYRPQSHSTETPFSLGKHLLDACCLPPHPEIPPEDLLLHPTLRPFPDSREGLEDVLRDPVMALLSPGPSAPPRSSCPCTTLRGEDPRAQVLYRTPYEEPGPDGPCWFHPRDRRLGSTSRKSSALVSCKACAWGTSWRCPGKGHAGQRTGRQDARRGRAYGCARRGKCRVQVEEGKVHRLPPACSSWVHRRVRGILAAADARAAGCARGHQGPPKPQLHGETAPGLSE